MRRGIYAFAIAVVILSPSALMGSQFKKPVYYSVPGLPLSIVTGDFNGDGSLDLAVADFSDGEVRILLGKANGTFRKGPLFSIAPYSPVSLAVGDFDGNGTVDLAVVEYAGTADGELGIFLGKGDGTFRQSAMYKVGFEPTSTAVADFDGDGNLDVAVSNEGVNGKGSVMVFFGKGSGLFGRQKTYKLGSQPYSVAAGDLNGDGHPDLAVAETNAGVAVLLNTGSGGFGKTTVYPVSPTDLSDVVIADLNHDDKPDLVVSTFQAVGVLLNKGAGKFGKAAIYSTKSITQENNPDGVVVADFNLDGNPDIATVIGAGNSGLFYGKGDGAFKKVVPILVKKDGGGEGLVTADFDKNNAPDLAILDSRGYVDVFLNSQ